MNTFETIAVTILGSGGLFSLIQYFFTRHDNKKPFATKEDLEPIKLGLLAIMQDRLEQQMTQHLNDGEITANQFKALTTMMNAYEANGGDDFIHTLYDQCKELVG